jgi:hypothetical protein
MLLAVLGVGAVALGQNYPPAVQKGFTLTTASPSYIVSGLNGQSNCTVTIASGATYGSGTLSFYTSGDNGTTYTLTTGIPDLGNPTSGGSQTTTGSPVKYTVPTAGQTNLELILAGSTGASVSGTVNCNAGVARIGGAGGGGPTPTPLPSSLTFSKLVCTTPVLCSPSTGPTPAVGFTNGPSFTTLTLPGITNAGLLGTTASGQVESVAFPTPGPLTGGNCWQITTTTPGPVYQGNYTCATPYPTPSVNATATACGTAVSASGLTVSVPVCPSPYPTPTAFATATSCGAPVAASGLTISVPVCPSPYPTPTTPVLRAKLAIALGANPGVQQTSFTFPVQQIVGYTAGEITELRVACATTGTSSTTFSATDVTSTTTIGTITLTSSSLTNTVTLGSPYALTAGHVLTMSVTAAGGHGNCSLIAEGQQQAF